MNPTVEQLLILADRADRLSPNEAIVLRAGIHALIDQQRQAAATIGGLQNAVRAWRNKAETATVPASQPETPEPTRKDTQ